MLYLSGFNEPDSCLVLEKETGQSKLFLKENDAVSLLWNGPITGPANSFEFFGLEAQPIESLHTYIGDRIDGSTILHDLNENSRLPDGVLAALQTKGKTAASLLQKMRVTKRSSEIAIMKDASQKSALAFKRTMKWSMGTKKESDVAARMEYECRIGGADGLAYVPVVAGGERANIIHYTRNDQVIRYKSVSNATSLTRG